MNDEFMDDELKTLLESLGGTDDMYPAIRDATLKAQMTLIEIIKPIKDEKLRIVSAIIATGILYQTLLESAKELGLEQPFLDMADYVVNHLTEDL